MRKHYVLGFVFNSSRTKVLLMKKLQPDWQKNKWNGIGGEIEENETPLEAMERESIEETGFIHPFEIKIIFTCPGGTVFVFAAKCSHPKINFNQIEDETLREWPIEYLPNLIIPNLKLFIPMCLADIYFPVMLHQTSLGG